MSAQKELIVFKDEHGKKYQLSNFSDSFILSSHKVLLVKCEIVDLPIRNKNILMVNAKRTESSDNKFGIGRIIKIDNDVTKYNAQDYVLFNKWNNCLEFNVHNTTYYVMKDEDIHCKVKISAYHDEKN